MPEYYKKVVCIQFKLSPEEKAEIEKGSIITFEGQAIKHTGGGRFHILLPIGDRLMPVHEGDWIVRHPAIEILRDGQFRSQYIEIENFDPIATQRKLEDLMRDKYHNQ